MTKFTKRGEVVTQLGQEVVPLNTRYRAGGLEDAEASGVGQCGPHRCDRGPVPCVVGAHAEASPVPLEEEPHFRPFSECVFVFKAKDRKANGISFRGI